MGANHGKGRIRLGAALALLMAAMTGTTAGTADAAAMGTGGLTSQPIGHYEFCQRKPAECSVRLRDRGPLAVTDAVWATVRRVNTAVNETVTPMSDFDIYGKEEHWTYPDQGVGDCEDYALEKRRQLAAKGISLSNLLITVVRKPDGEGHAVLTLRTNRGDFILDNLNNDLRPWRMTGYRFLKRQSSTHTGRWVTLRPDRNTLVGSVN